MKRRRLQQPPPYLDRRVAGNSVSTRRSMRTSAGRFMQFFLCVVMLMAFSVQKGRQTIGTMLGLSNGSIRLMLLLNLISAYIKIGVAAVMVIADSAAVMVISL